MLSATVGSAITSCHLLTGSCAVIITACFPDFIHNPPENQQRRGNAPKNGHYICVIFKEPSLDQERDSTDIGDHSMQAVPGFCLLDLCFIDPHRLTVFYLNASANIY